MRSREYKTMFAVEDLHWWYVGMQRITITLVAQFYPGQKQPAHSRCRLWHGRCGEVSVALWSGNRL